MTTAKPQILLTTVGTSLLGNLMREPDGSPLKAAHQARDAAAVAAELAKREPHERVNGAEVCSTASLINGEYAAADAGVYLFHSETDDGRFVADILARLFTQRGHAPVEAVEIASLRDDDPQAFRTKGLRNLAKALCGKARDHTPAACAFNATGGYKAQIAVAVLLGQALGVPTYYMHERFSDIIAFPPMPVSLDYEVWMRASGLFAALEGDHDPAPRSLFAGEWDERYESLVESVEVDGVEYLELSATGQIFHETFRERFRSNADRVLPPPAGRQQPPKIKGDEAHLKKYEAQVTRHMRRATDAVPQVVFCETTYFNPDLPQRTRFVEARGGVEGIFSDGTYTVRFAVGTTATTDGQRAAVVAALNAWLARGG